MLDSNEQSQLFKVGLISFGAVMALGMFLPASANVNLNTAVSTSSRVVPGQVTLRPTTGFSRTIQLPMPEDQARLLMNHMLQSQSGNAEAEAAPTSSSSWVGLTALAIAFLSGLALKRPTTVMWRMAAEGGEKVDDDDFDDMLAKLKAKGQAKAKAAGGTGFDKDIQQKKAAAIKQVVVEDVPENFDDEELFGELRPSPAELIVPAIGSLFIIGLIPLATGVVRQLWVRYKITSKRICITSGWGGNEYTEVSFKKIKEMKYVRRNLGADGDLVMELVGGGAVDMQSVPNFVETYNYIYDRITPDAQRKSMTLSRNA